MTRNEKINRGARAKELLESPMFTSTIEELMAETFGEFSATLPVDSDARESLYADSRALHRLTGRLKYFVSDGEQERRNANLDK